MALSMCGKLLRDWFQTSLILSVALPHCKMFSFKSNYSPECWRRHHLAHFFEIFQGGGVSPRPPSRVCNLPLFSQNKLACMEQEEIHHMWRVFTKWVKCH